MDKITDYFFKFRQTDGYRLISWATYICIVVLIITYNIFNFMGLLNGMGGILAVAGFALILLFYSIVIFLFIGVGTAQIDGSKKKKNNDPFRNFTYYSELELKPTNGKTNFIHDIGFGICFLGYAYYLIGAIFFVLTGAGK